ncbi:hypothetical protein EUTSA_v10022556mg [Eutrema salsugineum]|uniref:Uncharacterized protein n=1 Tax=Eutrema salsugineum TaxID=72664 RepID=V4M3W6_EUTSA|nr:uncharacterized protein LOC18025908 [Eutrema salsugineum]ESQ50914.1 hypothetical protein EUTSA_v10022556mg [Eutrema salsugineum]
MASPANNNSSSSPPIPNRPNPKPRNSEVGDPLRRSFGGNPFPANSKVNIPKDFSRRNSFGGRENPRVEFGDKENENKALPLPKASKNFMSPTISAVSKINPSPRKKVLSEKNELSRSSDTKGLILEETKSHRNVRSCVSFSEEIHIIGVDEKKRFEGSHDMTVTDFDENEVHENKGIVYSDPRFRISPRPTVPYTSPEFAGREVDTLLPPYDPKKNYLSPRPQFLHYKPNPRVEKDFDECKQLEELFISESSSSETELSAGESEKCEEQEEVAYPEDGAEAVVEEKEEVEDVEQLEAERDEEMVCESTEETSQVPKQSGFRKFKFLGWLLAMALGCLLVSATFSGLSILKESPFHEFHIPTGITEFAEANNLGQLSEKLWTLTESSVDKLISRLRGGAEKQANNLEQLSEKLLTLTESSLVYVDKLISRLRGRAEEHGPWQFQNLTYVLEDYTVFQPTSVEINEVPMLERSNLDDGYDNGFEEEGEGEENSEMVYEAKDGDAETNEFDEMVEMKPGTDIELNEGEANLEALFLESIEEQKESAMNHEENSEFLEYIKEQKESPVNHEENSEFQEQIETKSTKDPEQFKEDESEAVFIESNPINVHQPKETEVADIESGSEEGFGEVAAVTSDDLQPKLQECELVDAENVSEEGFGETAAETSDDLHPKVKSFNKAMIVSSSTVLVLLAAVAFLFAKKAKPVAASAPEPAPVTEKLNLVGHVPVENLMKESLSSLNLQAEEVEDRTSNSFHKKSSFLSEHQSGGGGGKKSNSNKNLRRESMASSASEYSVGSFSYGSFTTYEKIPIKSGDREEEMITPVRRSSRIRNNQPSGGL